MAELVDALASGASVFTDVLVRVQPRAPRCQQKTAPFKSADFLLEASGCVADEVLVLTEVGATAPVVAVDERETVARDPVILDNFTLVTIAVFAFAVGAKRILWERIVNVNELNASFDAAEEVVGAASRVDATLNTSELLDFAVGTFAGVYIESTVLTISITIHLDAERSVDILIDARERNVAHNISGRATGD